MIRSCQIFLGHITTPHHNKKPSSDFLTGTRNNILPGICPVVFRCIMNLVLLTALILACGQGATAQSPADQSCCSGITRQALGEPNAGSLERESYPGNNIPDGMVLVPGGEATIGSESGLPTERPVFTTHVPSFYMDRYLVTVGQFREFVNETGYVTFSEKIGDGIVFDHAQGRWVIEPGVYWEYPLGKDYGKVPDDHPVTLLTYDDAVAYLEWAGKRLPTEVEWEHAARGIANRDHPYAWGDKLVVDGKYQANTWTGHFPRQNLGEDGYILTSPVGKFGETELGLTDMGGNVWEWTSDWFRSYRERDTPYEPGEHSEKVIRGGSFMCHASYCHGYRVSARSHTPPDNNMFHIGFRGVKDIE